MYFYRHFKNGRENSPSVRITNVIIKQTLHLDWMDAFSKSWYHADKHTLLTGHYINAQIATLICKRMTRLMNVIAWISGIVTI